MGEFQADIEKLTDGERLREIEKLRARLAELEKPPRNDWHAWFLATLNISLYPYRDKIKIEAEHVLGVEPPRADFLIITEEDEIDFGLAIFKMFRKRNIIEFKNPRDALDARTIRKVIGYGSYYISQAPHKEGINPEDVTLSIFRDARPAKLMKELGGNIVPDSTEGIYRIQGMTDLPFQIVVTSELRGREYAGFRLMSKHAREDDVRQVLEDSRRQAEHFLIDQYRAYFDKLAIVNDELIDEIKRRYDMKYKGILDAFKPEIDEQISKARRYDLYKYVSDGGMSIDFAARQANVSIEDFEKDMIEHGYKVPQLMV